jgi:hypothetical protein
MPLARKKVGKGSGFSVLFFLQFEIRGKGKNVMKPCPRAKLFLFFAPILPFCGTQASPRGKRTRRRAENGTEKLLLGKTFFHLSPPPQKNMAKGKKEKKILLLKNLSRNVFFPFLPPPSNKILGRKSLNFLGELSSGL